MSWALWSSLVWSIQRGGGYRDRFFLNPLPFVSVGFLWDPPKTWRAKEGSAQVWPSDLEAGFALAVPT